MKRENPFEPKEKPTKRARTGTGPERPAARPPLTGIALKNQLKLDFVDIAELIEELYDACPEQQGGVRKDPRHAKVPSHSFHFRVIVNLFVFYLGARCSR